MPSSAIKNTGRSSNTSAPGGLALRRWSREPCFSISHSKHIFFQKMTPPLDLRGFTLPLATPCVLMGFSFTDFTCRYPNLLPFESAKDLEDLTQEVHDYATMEDEELPKAVKALAREKEGSSRLRPDIVWSHLQEMTTPDGRKRFPILSKVALLVLTIPYSNAGEERVFSMIKKYLTSL